MILPLMIILLIVVCGFRIWELDEHSFFELVSAGLGEFVLLLESDTFFHVGFLLFFVKMWR